MLRVRRYSYSFLCQIGAYDLVHKHYEDSTETAIISARKDFEVFKNKTGTYRSVLLYYSAFIQHKLWVSSSYHVGCLV